MTVGYRVWQFWRAATARVDSHDLLQVQAALPPQAFELFQAMPREDQRHSLAVWRALRARGHTERALLQAALLHDLAKAGKVRLVHRVLIVLLKAVRPSAVGRIARDNPRSWRHAFYVSLHHPALGAELAANAGAEPLAVELIRLHQTPASSARPAVPSELLSALQAVDDQN